MQILYEINTTLSEYDKLTKERKWVFPDYQDRCGICHRPNCACGNGDYTRAAYDENNRLIKDLIIKRYLCKTMMNKKNRKEDEDVTFSLLVDCLCPYRKFSIKIMTYVADVYRKFNGKITKTLANIFTKEEAAEELIGLEGSYIYQFIKVFKESLLKYRVWQKRSTNYSLYDFIKDCSRYKYSNAERLGIEYYTGNGGYIKSSQFLFGTASQFRGG